MNLVRVALLIVLLVTPMIPVEGSSTVVFRGHVGAAGKGYTIVWVEEVLEGPLTEGGVIEVLKGGGSCGRPHLDAVRVGDFVEVRGSLTTACCRQVVVLECGDHYLKKLRNVLETGIRILQGCGSEVKVESNVTFVFFVSRDSNVTITLERGEDRDLLFEGFLKAGLYSFSKLDGGPEGERRVCILAESSGESAVSCCEYVAISRIGGKSQPEYENLTVKVVTEAGYPVRNASVYIDGKLYGFTDRKGILETNISEGVHEVRVESQYYKTAATESGPGLVVLRVGVKAPEVSLSFSPERVNGSGVVRLVVRRLGGADISIRVKLTPFGNLRVNTTELVGVPPFNATIEVQGEGKLVASYGKITAVLISEVPKRTAEKTQRSEIQTLPSSTSEPIPATPTPSSSTSTHAQTTVEEVPSEGGWMWIGLLAAGLLIAVLLLRKLRGAGARIDTSPPSSGGSAPD